MVRGACLWSVVNARWMEASRGGVRATSGAHVWGPKCRHLGTPCQWTERLCRVCRSCGQCDCLIVRTGESADPVLAHRSKALTDGSSELGSLDLSGSRPRSDSQGELVGERRAAKAGRVGTAGFLTCGKRGGDALTPDTAMRSAVPWPAWKGFWAWQKVADNSIDRAGSSVCTLGVFAAGRWRARPQAVGRTLGAARCTLNGLVRLGCLATGPGILGRHGDRPRTGRSLSTFGGSDPAAPGTQGDG